MKYLNFYFVLLLATSFSACNSAPKEKPAEDTKNGFLRVLDLRTDLDSVRLNQPLYRIRKMVATNDYLFALLPEKDTVFKVFDAKTAEYLGGFGFEGEGPEDLEFNAANASSFRVYDDGFFIGDRSRIRTFEVEDFEGKFSQNYVKVSSSNYIPEGVGSLNNAFITNKNSLFTTDNFTKKHLIHFNMESEEATDSIDFPSLFPEIPITAYHHLYRSHLAISHDRKTLAIAYGHFPFLRIINMENGNSKDVQFNPKKEQKKEIKVDARGMSVDAFALYSYYQSAQVSDNRIYALYRESEMGQDEQGQWHSLGITPLEMHVYDWSGKPLKKLILPAWANRYTVTPDDEFIYFFHPENADYIFRKSMKD